MLTTTKAFSTAHQFSRLPQRHTTIIRAFQTSPRRFQQEERSDPAAHRNFWKSHGRAILKALTLAFFSYQVFYWTWITLETEHMKDQKGYEIKSLESEVRLLEEGRKSHRPGEIVEQATKAMGDGGKRILEEGKKP